MVANILLSDFTLGNGFKIQLFSEHGHVAYQDKGNHVCSNMVANILPADPSPTPTPLSDREMGSVGQISTFSEHGHVAYQIKFFAHTLPPRPWGSKGQNSTFSERGHVAYQIK